MKTRYSRGSQVAENPESRNLLYQDKGSIIIGTLNYPNQDITHNVIWNYAGPATQAAQDKNRLCSSQTSSTSTSICGFNHLPVLTSSKLYRFKALDKAYIQTKASNLWPS